MRMGSNWDEFDLESLKLKWPLILVHVVVTGCELYKRRRSDDFQDYQGEYTVQQ